MVFHSCDKVIWLCLEMHFYLDCSLSCLCTLPLGGCWSAPEASEALGAVWGHLRSATPQMGRWGS